MATFSWTDTARAVVASCLPCLPSSRHADSVNDRERVTRRDELESLLQGAEFTDTETDADVLSLHSHIGQQDGRRRVKKSRKPKRISVFGFDLFGRPLLDAEEDEDRRDRRISRISSSTLDSDAAPLPDDAIAELSAQTVEQRAADEAHRERRRLRTQQKAASLLDAHANSFEGFPGSGTSFPDEFGAFQQAPLQQEQEFVHIGSGGVDEADVEADFDAGSYARSAPLRSDSDSGTRSRTSNSSTRPQPHRVPLPPPSSDSNSMVPSPSKPKRSKKIKSGKHSSTTLSSTTTSQPRSPASAGPAPHVEIAGSHQVEFEGVPMSDDGCMDTQPHQRGGKPVPTGGLALGDQEQRFSSSGLWSREFGQSDGFPSPTLIRSGGFPSSRLGGRKSSLSMGVQGAFLARKGEDP